MSEGDEAALGVMRPQRAWPRLGHHAHRAALSHLRLLLDVELHPLHLGQYDLRRKQQVRDRLRRRQPVGTHRAVEDERSIRGAHQAPQITADPQPLAEVARDRPEVGAAAAAHLDAGDRPRTRLKIEEGRRIHLDLARGRPDRLACPREPVGAFAFELYRRVRGRLLKDAACEGRQSGRQVVGGQMARIGHGLRIGFSVVGRRHEPEMDVGEVGLRQLQCELGQARRRLEQDRQHPGGQGVKRSGVPNPSRAGQPAQAVDHRERGLAGGLVEIEYAGCEAGLKRCPRHHAAGSNFVGSSAVR